MSMLLATTNAWNYVLIAVVVLLLIAMPIMMNSRNKRESQKIQEQTNSLKVGDKILTTSGVYGTITELKFDDTQKLVVIETGGKVKSYMSIDAYAIYTVFKSDAELAKEAAEREASEKARNEQENEEKESKKAKNKKAEEVVVETSEAPAEAEKEMAVEEKTTEKVDAEAKKPATKKASKKSTSN